MTSGLHRRQFATPGLPGSIELMGRIREWSLHERRECGCRHVQRSADMMDSACLVPGTDERQEHAERAHRMREAARNARDLRRIAAWESSAEKANSSRNSAVG